MSKTLLIICGGKEAAEIARAVKDSGHTVVVSDSDPEAPAFAFADSCLIADVHGASETAAAAERYSRKIRKIDGVLCAADAALTAATVTDRLRLPGMPLHVAELLSDRLLMRRAFASAGIATPWHAQIFTPQDLQRTMIARGHALMVKPVENRGSLGVRRLEKSEEFGSAFQQACAASPSQRVMVEQGFEGHSVQVAALMLENRCHVAAAVEDAMAQLVARAASALGVGEGPVMCEMAMHQGALHVTEFSARLGGAAPVAAAAQLALGEEVSLKAC
jgi:biotin carboxylase